MRNKTIPIPHLGCLLSRSRNSHNKKHAVAGYTTKIVRFRKDPMVHEKEYLCYMKNLNCNGLVAEMGITLSQKICIPLYVGFKL
jgi:hypothetical protein